MCECHWLQGQVKDITAEVVVLTKALQSMEEQVQTERDFHVVQLTRVHTNTIERFENTVERRVVRTRGKKPKKQKKQKKGKKKCH